MGKLSDLLISLDELRDRHLAARKELAAAEGEGHTWNTVRFSLLVGALLLLAFLAARRMVRFIGAIVDEERKTAEQLRESEERFRALLDNAPATIFLKDAHGRYVLANRLFEKLNRTTTQEARGKTPHDFFPAELANQYEAMDRQVIETGTSVEAEVEAMHQDGTITPAMAVKFPIHGADGNVTGVGGINIDLTERNRAKTELKRNLTDQKIIASILRLSLQPLPLETILEQILALTLTEHGLSLNAEGNIFLIDGRTGDLILKAQKGLAAPLVAACARVPAGRYLCGRAGPTTTWSTRSTSAPATCIGRSPSGPWPNGHCAKARRGSGA
jgi:PAS domain S-box-containing protein